MSVVVHQEMTVYQQDVFSNADNDTIIATSNNNNSNESSKPLIGIIYPPPEVRNIIDRTSEFIARNGVDFEVKIRENEKGNPKFNFLNDADPYHVYYKHRIEEIKQGKVNLVPQMQITAGNTTNTSDKNQQALQLDLLVPKEPPPSTEFMYDPPTISSLDLNIVKLTAMFVAKNGRSFFNKLMDKEQKNYQFDFLRQQHSLYSYYNKLVDQYAKVLVPTKSTLDQLEANVQNPNILMSKAERKYHWNKYQRRIKQSEEEKRERERQEYSKIDWHDFVLVETITFDDDNDTYLPPPITRQQLTARLIAQAKHERERNVSTPAAASTQNKIHDSDEEGVDMMVNVNEKVSTTNNDEASIDNEASRMDELEPIAQYNSDTINSLATSNTLDSTVTTTTTSITTLNRPIEMEHLPKLTTLLPSLDVPVKIRSDYDPKAVTRYPSNLIQSAPPVDAYLTSPITGEMIHKEKASTHVKHLLVDPKWRETQQRMVENAKQQDYVYAEGSQITQNLRDLADRRTDIFGSGGEETLIGKKIDEERLSDNTDFSTLTSSAELVAQLAQSTTIDNALLVLKDSITDTTHIQKPFSTKSLSAPVQSIQINNNSSTTGTTNLNSAYPESREAKSVNIPSSHIPTPLMSNMAPNFTSYTQTSPLVPQRPATPIRYPYDSNLPPLPNQPALNTHNPLFLQRAPAPPNLSRMISPQNLPTSNIAPHSHPHQMSNPYFNNTLPNVLMNQMPVHAKANHDGVDTNTIKRVRIDGEEQLIPEEDYLRLHSGSVSFKVYCPNVPDKPEWTLTGQILTISLPITDHVSVIKARITTLIGMPVGKQKLQLDNLFIKDSNTLAFYNFDSDSVVQLFIKERGGRKK